MIKKATVIVLALTMVGCASTATVKIDDSHSAAMQERSLAIASSDRPDFAAMTADKGMFAMIGALAMISSGNEIVRENDIDDPAVYIGEQLAKELAESHLMDLVMPVISSDDSAVESLIATHAAHDYVLDVRTINWSFGYYPTDWDNYRILYSVKARLLDIQRGEVIGEAFCSRVPEQTADSPSYKQLLDNQAARLKTELRISADHCLDELRSKLL